jgi:hypothetical protein
MLLLQRNPERGTQNLRQPNCCRWTGNSSLIFIFSLTLAPFQGHNPPRSLGNLRDSGHHPGPNELACEACSPVSRGNLLDRARIGTMASLFRRFFYGCCTHRFAWPRISLSGQHYQVCLRCGAAYQYDWTTMRRSNRLVRGDSHHV